MRDEARSLRVGTALSLSFHPDEEEALLVAQQLSVSVAPRAWVCAETGEDLAAFEDGERVPCRQIVRPKARPKASRRASRAREPLALR